jgi:hypothetical protein
MDPTELPTQVPTRAPTTAPPTITPTQLPSTPPSLSPSLRPSTEPTLTPSALPTKAPTQAPTRRPTVRPTGNPTRRPTAEPTMNPFAPKITKSAVGVGTTTLDITLTLEELGYVRCQAVPPSGQGFDSSPAVALPTLDSNASNFRTLTPRLRITGAREGARYGVYCTTRNALDQSATYLIRSVRMLDFSPPVVLLSSNRRAGVAGLNITIQLDEPGNYSCRAISAAPGAPASTVATPPPAALLTAPSSSQSRLVTVTVSEAYSNFTAAVRGLAPARSFAIFCYARDASGNGQSTAVVAASRLSLTTPPYITTAPGDDREEPCGAPPCSLRAAITTAARLYQLFRVSYPVVLNGSGGFLLDAPITVRGPGARVWVVGQGVGVNSTICPAPGVITRLLNVEASATLSLVRVRLEGGNASEGALLRVSGRASVNLTSCILSGGAASGAGGGAIFATGQSRVFLNGTRLEGNAAIVTPGDGGLGSGTIRRRLGASAVNSAGLWGGGIGGAILATNGTSLMLHNTTVRENLAGKGGGGMAVVNGSTLVIRNCYLANNTVDDGMGGALLVFSPGSAAVVVSSRLVGNAAGLTYEGSSLYVGAGGSASLRDTVIVAEQRGRSVVAGRGRASLLNTVMSQLAPTMDGLYFSGSSSSVQVCEKSKSS